MDDRAILAELAIEFWKLHGAFERVVDGLAFERGQKASAQLRYSRSQLERLLENATLRMVRFDGEVFTAELPVTAVNAGDLEGTAELLVESTLEPAIVADGTIVRLGKVVLKGAE